MSFSSILAHIQTLKWIKLLTIYIVIHWLASHAETAMRGERDMENHSSRSREKMAHVLTEQSKSYDWAAVIKTSSLLNVMLYD